ncbi:MAG: alanine racemase [Anaerolineae bacterium]|nr:alanine racemase [Anaerolineae bacterium]
MMGESSPYTSWLEINLNAIQNNVRQFKRLTNKAVMAVLKANAYGHGVTGVARAVAEAGADWCAVARLEEALALRKKGINLPILVLGYTQVECIPAAIEHDISLAVFDAAVTQQYLEKIQQHGGRLKVHVKIDTGMGRLGLFPQEGLDFISWLQQQPGIEVEGLFTHFARADEPALITTPQQIKLFKELVQRLEAANRRPRWVHACNSAGVFNYPEAYFDMVRPGISLYGLNPSAETQIPSDFSPALTWKTRLVSVKNYPPGYGISYSHIYTTSANERIGVIAIGYADNYRRTNGNIALVAGKRVNVVGRVCMDQSMVQLDRLPEARVGDEVVLIGHQADAFISADEVAAIWKTANYEVVANLADRLPRIYV